MEFELPNTVLNICHVKRLKRTTWWALLFLQDHVRPPDRPSTEGYLFSKFACNNSLLCHLGVGQSYKGPPFFTMVKGGSLLRPPS